MDKNALRYIRESVPKINPRIAEGIAAEYLKKADKYIDSIWRSTAESFPEGLRYIGKQRCTPEEEVHLLTRRSKSVKFYDLSRTDGFMVRYTLGYRPPGEQHETTYDCYFRLPYVGKGGSLFIRGSKWTISPVMVDPIFSPTSYGLFQSMVKSKEKYFRMSYHFKAGGQRHRATVVWSPIHKEDSSRKNKRGGGGGKTVRRARVAMPESTLMHYLFAVFGATNSFAKMGAEVKFGYPDDLADFVDNPEWVICTSSKIKPSTASKIVDYRPSNICIAVKATDMSNSTRVMSAIGSFFYIADHFPDRVKPEYIDNTRVWKILLGLSIFRGEDIGEGVLVEKIERHLNSLPHQADAVFKETLREAGIIIDDIYDLFIHVIETIQQRLIEADPTSLYGKRLMVLEYVLSDVVRCINLFSYDLQKLNKPILADREIANTLKNRIIPEIFFKNNYKHGEVNMISSPCDNILLEHTTKVVQQTSASVGGGYGSGQTDLTKLLHSSLAEVVSYGNQRPSDPCGRGVLNWFLQLTDEGAIKRNEKFIPLLNAVQQRIRRM